MQIAGWKTKGIEINANAVKQARQRLGLDVHQGQLDDFEMPAMSFDAITFWDVIEHTFDPLATLQKTHFLLKDNGIVVMTLPNWQSFDHWLFGSEWIGYDAPRHLFIFPREVLIQLLKTAGFDVLRIWCGLGGYFTFIASLRLWLNVHVKNTKIKENILRFTDIPGIRYLFQPFFSFTDRLNAGGTLIVVAKKSGDE
jgi:SAM-dependent methyltransferase